MSPTERIARLQAVLQFTVSENQKHAVIRVDHLAWLLEQARIVHPKAEPKSNPNDFDKSSDGVTLQHGMDVWFFANKKRDRLVMAKVDAFCDRYWTFRVGNESSRWIRNAQDVYSTRAAAMEGRR